MELEYWISTFRTMGTNASMLTGFTFGAMYAAQDSESFPLNLVFLVFTACSMGFGMLSITTSSFCLMFGREQALMGG
jgi:hypothetical protein